MRFQPAPEDEGKRLDVLISERTGITRSQVKKLIETGGVLVKGSPAKPGEKARAGGIVDVFLPEAPREGLDPEPIPLHIVYKDDHLAIVEKPAGLVVYPAAGHPHGTLLNAIAFHCGKLARVGAPLRPGVVHRLDKDTSGLMVVALEDNAYYGLLGQFKDRTIKRSYLALVNGAPKEDQGVISLRIGRSEHDRKKMSTRVRNGREAVTNWKVLERFAGKAALLECVLGTGRTHQIRVHLSSIGHSVLGDRTYGKKVHLEIGNRKVHIPRQMLHARLLGFTHPSTGEYVQFESGLPEDMELVLKELRSAFGGHAK